MVEQLSLNRIHPPQEGERVDFRGENGGCHQEEAKKICHKVADALSEQSSHFFGKPLEFIVDLFPHALQEEDQTDKEGDDVVKNAEKQQPGSSLILVDREMQQTADHHQIEAAQASRNHGYHADTDGNQEERCNVQDRNRVTEDSADGKEKQGDTAPVQKRSADQSPHPMGMQIAEEGYFFPGRNKEQCRQNQRRQKQDNEIGIKHTVARCKNHQEKREKRINGKSRHKVRNDAGDPLHGFPLSVLL